MTPVRRIIKRLTIIFVYLAIVFLIGAGFYYLFRREPTCSDKIQNQGETGLDCGGPCEKCEEIPQIEGIRVLEKSIIPSETGKYDALVKIENPNSQFGAENISYSFNLLDTSGKIISKSEGTAFILPAQIKYILAFNIPSTSVPASVDFRISSFEWNKFTEYSEPNVPVYAREFNLSSGGSAGFAELKAKIRNQSGYDFHQIGAVAVIRSGEGKVVAINQTSFNDVRVNEEREINFKWNNTFQVDPVSAKIEIIPDINVFGSENYMRQHGVPGQYKSYNPSN